MDYKRLSPSRTLWHKQRSSGVVNTQAQAAGSALASQEPDQGEAWHAPTSGPEALQGQRRPQLLGTVQEAI